MIAEVLILSFAVLASAVLIASQLGRIANALEEKEEKKRQ